MATAKVPLDSEIIRKSWLREGLLQRASRSFWNAYKGRTMSSVIMQKKDLNARDGNTIVFDADGNIAARPIRGRETAYGKGQEKKKFEDSITLQRYRLPVDNGDAFDGREIGDLSITQHGDSRRKLADNFIRFTDQAIFDTTQGLLGQAPTHIFEFDNTGAGTPLDYNGLLDLENAVKTSSGYGTGSTRRPLNPYYLNNGMGVFLFIVDSYVATAIKKAENYQTIVVGGDVRGNRNRALSGLLGKLGSLLIVEAPSFFGVSTGAIGYDYLDRTITEISGMRNRDSNGLWTGFEGYDPESSELHSRCLLMGAGAVFEAFGKMPDYKFQASEDYGITSESALETYYSLKKAKWKPDNGDYASAKVASIDYGVNVVDVRIR